LKRRISGRYFFVNKRKVFPESEPFTETVTAIISRLHIHMSYWLFRFMLECQGMKSTIIWFVKEIKTRGEHCLCELTRIGSREGDISIEQNSHPSQPIYTF
jgi:hypothetical protein